MLSIFKNKDGKPGCSATFGFAKGPGMGLLVSDCYISMMTGRIIGRRLVFV